MKLLITNATVADPQSPLNTKKCDLLVNNGVIEDIQLSAKKAFGTSSIKTFDAKGAFISPGWVDMRSALREPGFEYKEDLNTASKAAAAGGFTTIVCLPSTQPAIQTKADVEFILNKAESLPVHILPYGAITKNREGTELNELYDMHQAGAVGFTDGNKTIMHAGIIMRAMQYAGIFGGLLFNHAEDTQVAPGGMIHEGAVSTGLGMKGIPNIAEEIIIARDIELAKYVNTPIHISHITSKGSVELIRKAKKQGILITCDVAVANLVFTDEQLESFDNNYKLSPPLRGKTDQKALWDGLIDGTIDCIVTDHHPEDPEHKDVEFEYAAQGMIQLQTAYSLLNMYAPKTIDTETLIKALSVNPRKILKRDPVKIEKGAKAELTVFDPEKKWEYTETNNYSRSKNSPVLGLTLMGKALAIINKDRMVSYQ